LRKIALGDLRFLLSERLSLEEVEVTWFDLYNRKSYDEIQVRNVALMLVELIGRSRREGLLLNLIETLCRNYPSVESKGWHRL
jgi:hypothetical protein